MDILYRLGEIDRVAELLWKEGAASKVWAFHGPMGSGKTTLIHHLCDFLQVKGRVSSPTFALINSYESPIAGTICHMDWYRLKNEAEAVQAGIQDSLQSGQLCLVEWPENAPGLLERDTFRIYLEVLGGNKRRLATYLP